MSTTYPATDSFPLEPLLTFPPSTALSECFVNVTCYELAYARSAPNMRSVVIAIFLFMNCLNYALQEILTPLVVDPYLIWAYAAPAIVLFAQTAIFWFRYRKFNDDEFMIGYDEGLDEKTRDDASDRPQAHAPPTIVEETKH